MPGQILGFLIMTTVQVMKETPLLGQEKTLRSKVPRIRVIREHQVKSGLGTVINLGWRVATEQMRGPPTIQISRFLFLGKEKSQFR